MLMFNTPNFGLFLIVALTLYWWNGRSVLKIQNIAVLGLSFFFYGWWDERFLLLIAVSTLVDYGCRRHIQSGEGDRRLQKQWLRASLGVNLGMLNMNNSQTPLVSRLRARG